MRNYRTGLFTCAGAGKTFGKRGLPCVVLMRFQGGYAAACLHWRLGQNICFHDVAPLGVADCQKFVSPPALMFLQGFHFG